MVTKTKLFLIILFCCVPFISNQAFFNKDFHQLSMQHGLADNTILSIYKDKDGFMWFATGSGLSRYDGISIKNFRNNSSDMSVSAIFGLADYCLGVIVSGQLYAFNRRTETFIPIKTGTTKNEIHISRILKYDGGRFWGIWENELTLYKIEENKDKSGCVVSISLAIEKTYSHILDKKNVFVDICFSKGKKGIYLVTRDAKLILFDYQSRKVTKSLLLFSAQDSYVNSMLNDNDFIWIATVGNGVFRYCIRTGNLDHLTYKGLGRNNMLSHTDAFQIIPMNKNRYLIVTWNGYTFVSVDDENPEKITAEIYNNAAFLNRNLETRMLSAYCDPDGILWIGTNGGGVLYSDLRLQYYNQFHQDRHNEICGIVADEEKYIWLATFHKGIMRSDMPYKSSQPLNFTSINVDEVKKRETVLSLLKDVEGNLWFGNKDGTLTGYDKRTKKLTVFPLHILGKGLNVSPIWALFIDSKNNFLIGTGRGLLTFDSKKNICKQVKLQDERKKEMVMTIRAITETKDGTIWLGTTEMGLCKLKLSGEYPMVRMGYEAAKGMQTLGIRSLLTSTDGNVYVGYDNGFAIFSPKRDAICEFYTTHEGLCSNFIGSIVEDPKGHIWLGSNSGISRYSRHQHLFYNYYIAGSNRSALLLDKTLFWGNNKSLTYFNPDDVNTYQIDNKVYITGLEVANRSVGIGENIHGQIILQKGISFTERVVLSNDNRDFSLTFNDLFYSEEQQKYNYRLLPYQNSWLVSNKGGRASFTNLPAGEYTFEVKNIYPDGQEGEITTLQIEILPHWSHTPFFRILVLLVMVGIAVYWIRIYRNRRRRKEHELQMKHELLTLNLEHEKEKQIRTEREIFFTSAAHELRTPLTLILSPLQGLLYRMNPTEKMYDNLQIIYKNAFSLNSLVDQLLYVQKIEAGMVKLQLFEVDIIELIRNTADSFKQMAETKGYNFSVILPESPYYLWIDTEKMSSAIRNLLSNAFKYTPPGGSVSVVVTKMLMDGKDFCVIKVSDTGVGIPIELQDRIFDSFITGDNIPVSSTKVGIGLRIVKNTVDLHHGWIILDSSLNKGSSFELRIPEGKMHFSEDPNVILNSDEIANAAFEELPLFQPDRQEQQKRTDTKYKLLIIEDNEEIRTYLKSFFESEFSLLEAKNGEEGVRVAMEQLPDLIISDIMMPVMDGFACCREIRNKQEIAHIPILMLTAKAEDRDILQSSQCGADDYMMKPFNPEVLKAKVNNLILQRERLKRIYTKALMLKHETSNEDQKDEFMQSVIYNIEKNLTDESLSVKSLAESLNMSQPTLYRKMKQHTDLKVIDIIRSVRVSKAASLIMENRYTIQEISEMVGFTDTRTFRKHFIEQFGVSPSKYASDDVGKSRTEKTES